MALLYITKQDYFDFSGIDLDIELKSVNSDNPTKQVDIFLERVERAIINHLRHKYFLQDEDIDAEAMKEACLHQIDYLRTNGDLSQIAGNVLPKLAPNAYQALKWAGMCNVALHNPPTIDPFF